MKADNAIPFFPFANTAACGHNGAGDLVSEYLRRSYEAMLDFLQVRSTNATRGYPNENITVRDFRDRNIFSRDASGSSVNAGTHLPGKRSTPFGIRDDVGA
jgi:hypothetical protein